MPSDVCRGLSRAPDDHPILSSAGEELLFSTHGLFDFDDVDDSHLVLTDGKLRLAEVLMLGLDRTWLTVMSACETGRVELIAEGDEYQGLKTERSRPHLCLTEGRLRHRSLI